MKFIFPTPHFHWERWKWFVEYGMYVSTHGHLRDKDKQLITPKVQQNGYMVVKVHNKIESLHQIVARTWMPVEGMSFLTVDHLDHNKRNNTIWNLEWCTEKENKERAKRDLETAVPGPASVEGEAVGPTQVADAKARVWIMDTATKEVNRTMSWPSPSTDMAKTVRNIMKIDSAIASNADIKAKIQSSIDTGKPFVYDPRYTFVRRV